MPITATGTTQSPTTTAHGYYYIGNSVRDYVLVSAPGGAATNATLACTIYQPDNSTATPTPTNDATGIYHIDFTPTMAGVHTIRWVATGAVTGADEHIICVKKGATG